MALRRAAPVLAAAAMAACSAGNSPSSAPMQVGTELAADQTLARTIDQSPSTLDPALATDADSTRVLTDLFEGLTANAPDGSIVPGGATSWQVSADGRNWSFHLRHGARWSNGEALTAADYLYAWRHQVDPRTGAENAQELLPIANAEEIVNGRAAPETLGVDAPDPYTIHIALTHPTPYLLDLLADAFMAPLPRATLERYGDDWTRPEHMVCNGPFFLKSEVIGNRVELAKNPYYWDADSVRLKRVFYFPIDRATQPARFMSGDVAYTDFFTPLQYRWLQSQLGTQVQVGSYLGTWMLAFNMREPPFAGNRNLRLALSMALDREILAAKVMQGLFPPAYLITPPMPGYHVPMPAWASWSPERRHAEARRLYAAAGYSPAHPLRVELAYSTDPSLRDLYDAMAAMWRTTLGAEIEPYNEEFRVLLQDLFLHKAKLFQNNWIAEYPDPYSFLQLYKRDYAMNFGAYSEAHFEALVAAAAQEPDSAKRYQVLAQAEMLLNDDVPAIALLYYATPHLVKPYLKGVPRNALDIDGSRYMYILEHQGR
jgi:oligopeptide transport system substrate-binding protein